MKKIVYIITFLLLANAGISQEVKGLKQVFDMSVDELGNAVVEVSMKLNASQWDMFKKNIGNNTSIMKREIEKSLPKYFLSDFSYSEDAMDRSYKVKFKALGIVSINSDGKWEARLDSKDPDVTKLSEREFVMNANMMSNGMLIQQTQKIHLPEGAGDAKIEKDSFGKAVMTYSGNTGTVSRIGLFAGLALILAGVVLFFRNMNESKNKLRVVNKETMVA